MKRKFEFEFEDESYGNEISFEYDDETEENMVVEVNDGMPTMYANQQALMALGKTFIKMALCDYKDGFHIHLRKDLDGDQPETITVVLNRDN